ncbi:hypothetical protein [Corynebacterium senegalense]|uniref:hypothetical protein n=1 Tax=Corynebacterium senegalense TaxID=2080750 RepID=UPI001FE5AAAD|nr:hypothetical protein [Corynebacterium senegalense]
MSARLAAGFAATALGAVCAGCSGGAAPQDETGLTGPTWQIVALYTDPATPGELPADAAGKASLAFGDRSMTGQTGCAAVKATTTTEGEVLRLADVEISDIGECDGGSRYVHDRLVGLLTPGAGFEVRRLGEGEAVLTKTDAGVEPPSIRVMSL